MLLIGIPGYPHTPEVCVCLVHSQQQTTTRADTTTSSPIFPPHSRCSHSLHFSECSTDKTKSMQLFSYRSHTCTQTCTHAKHRTQPSYMTVASLIGIKISTACTVFNCEKSYLQGLCATQIHIAEPRPVSKQREADLRGGGEREEGWGGLVAELSWAVRGRAARTPGLTNHPKRA